MQGCRFLAHAYEEGIGVIRDMTKAAVFYQRACDGDEMRACGDLGTLYLQGTGVARDAAKAVTLYQKACSGGDAMACSRRSDIR